ncbi:hypothetical protein OS493_035952 [Desmophyllum pertusum]|uniref:Uncharacterized protein n=1 Tax=Desmophyllum pertusum TaxID=174260 RepID=A0A9X0CHZ0_9CNID|nr:hypothetical protein OS493_035952 [Desmophyllum pertusum]
MKRRSHKRRTTRRAKLGNPLCNPEDDIVIAFAPSGGGPGIDEAGYARVVNPTGRKGYAYLKPAPERRSRCEYQKLNLKPTEIAQAIYCHWKK